MYRQIGRQYVIIDDEAVVNVTGNYQCKIIEVSADNVLTVTAGSNMLMSSNGSSTAPSALVGGVVLINRRCMVESSGSAAFEVYGHVINNNKGNTKLITEESVIVRAGGQFTNIDKSV